MKDMKKYFLCIVLLSAACFLYAQENVSGDDPEEAAVSTDAFWDMEFAEALIAEDEVPAEAPFEAPPEKRNRFVRAMYGLKDYMNNPDVPSPEYNKHRRVFEIVLPSAHAMLSTNFLTLKELFKKNIIIDINKIEDRVPKRGFGGINTSVDISGVEFNFNHPKKDWGFGLTPAGIKGGIDIRLPRSFLGLLADGNQGKNGDVSGRFLLSGAVFYEFGVNTHFNVQVARKPMRLNLNPAFYVPMLYIPKSSIDFHLQTNTQITGSVNGEFSVYTPVNYNRMDTFDVGQMLSSGGVDISVSAEYPLFTRLDVGASISHIPFFPAELGYGMKGTVNKSGAMGNIGDLLDQHGGMSEILPSIDDMYELSAYGPLDSLRIFRPVRFDFYTLYRPLKSDLLVIRPNIGVTLPTKSSIPYFNGALEAQLHVGKFMPGYFFNLSLSTGREEGFWRHRLGMQLNLRAFELDLGVGLRSQSYLASYRASGLELMIGLKFGW
jgi:hypothetical protein